DLPGEVELNMFILRCCYDRYGDLFDARTATFYRAVVRLTLRTARMVKTKLHEDYRLDHRDDLTWFLAWAADHPRKYELSFDLPRRFEDV
ncbi:MAG: hypothetical protein WBA12_05250, partial [Catalinimonas sp.]